MSAGCRGSLSVFQIQSHLFCFEEYCCGFFKRIECCQDVSTNPVHNPFNKRAHPPVAIKLNDTDLQYLLH